MIGTAMYNELGKNKDSPDNGGAVVLRKVGLKLFFLTLGGT